MRKALVGALVTAAVVMQPGASSGGPLRRIHATLGIVKSIDATVLVITRRGRLSEMTFNLTPETHREGTLVVGSAVSVRYREDGTNHIATAIAVQRPRD